MPRMLSLNRPKYSSAGARLRNSRGCAASRDAARLTVADAWVAGFGLVVAAFVATGTKEATAHAVTMPMTRFTEKSSVEIRENGRVVGGVRSCGCVKYPSPPCKCEPAHVWNSKIGGRGSSPHSNHRLEAARS